jgi:hypothetical protein
MVPRRSGKIINLCSLLTFQGGVTVPAYAASKGAVAQLTKALSNEWSQHNVQVNAICPGYINTDMYKRPFLFKSPRHLLFFFLGIKRSFQIQSDTSRSLSGFLQEGGANPTTLLVLLCSLQAMPVGTFVVKYWLSTGCVLFFFFPCFFGLILLLSGLDGSIRHNWSLFFLEFFFILRG